MVDTHGMRAIPDAGEPSEPVAFKQSALLMSQRLNSTVFVVSDSNITNSLS
jgi:hypothetical protein